MFRTAGCAGAGRRKNCRARKSSPAIRTLPIALPHCATFFHTATISYASLERDAGKSKSGSRSILRYTKPPVRGAGVANVVEGPSFRATQEWRANSAPPADPKKPRIADPGAGDLAALA